MRRRTGLMRGRSLIGNQDGVAAIDFAFAMPVLLVIIIGILQIGMAFQTNAGMRNAVEIGTRYATIYPTPTDAEIFAKLSANAFGLGSMASNTLSSVGGCPRYSGTAVGGAGTYTVTICHGTANSESYTEVTMVYPVKLNLLLYGGTINLTYARRAYRQ